MSNYIKKGDQFWNDDRSEWYEMAMDILLGTMLKSEQFIALGSAPEPRPNYPLPKWMADIILVPGGVKAYKEKSNS